MSRLTSICSFAVTLAASVTQNADAQSTYKSAWAKSAWTQDSLACRMNQKLMVRSSSQRTSHAD